MKKILPMLVITILFTASFAFAQDGTGTPTNSATIQCIKAPCTVPTTPTPTDMACIQTAVTTRETAIVTAWTNFSSATSTALTARATALNTAWGITDAKERRTARNAAWNTYKTDAKKAGWDLKAAKRTAWEAFKVASKACKVSVVESEPTLGVSF